MKCALAFLLLLATGVFAMPVMASVLDGAGTENYILPAALLGTAALGALLGRFWFAISGLGGG